jgi:hypothetical protein
MLRADPKSVVAAAVFATALLLSWSTPGLAAPLSHQRVASQRSTTATSHVTRSRQSSAAVRPSHWPGARYNHPSWHHTSAWYNPAPWGYTGAQYYPSTTYYYLDGIGVGYPANTAEFWSFWPLPEQAQPPHVTDNRYHPYWSVDP